ncbi:UNVERIFIED_CONTAM: hypothetical protein RMT77_001634 [Armadillidium vulgare]
MPKMSVVLWGGPPWGFRLQGGGHSSLFISRVTSNGKASSAGVRAGSKVTSINGTPTSSLTLSAAHALTKQGSALTLELETEPSTPHPSLSSVSSSASSCVTVVPARISNTNHDIEKVHVNSKSETRVSSKESDSEGENIKKGSFADDDEFSPQNSVDLRSLLSSEISPPPDDNRQQSSSDFSTPSGSSCNENRLTLTEGEELNLTDLSIPPSETSESTVVDSEYEYGSISSGRDSFREQSEECYIINDDYDERNLTFLTETPEKITHLSECDLDDNAQLQKESLKYCSTIIEESEEDDSVIDQSKESFGLKSDMGQQHSNSRNRDSKKNAKNKINNNEETRVVSHSSDHWRLSEGSTNSNVSSSTGGGGSDDTLGQNMSELSSINSKLSGIGQTSEDFKSLERTEASFSLREQKISKDDPEATPKATPIPPKRSNTIIRNAIDELESIELAAQHLLQQSHSSPIPKRSFRSTSLKNNDANSKESIKSKTNKDDKFEESSNQQQIYKVNGHAVELGDKNKNVLHIENSSSNHNLNSKPIVRKKWEKPNELKPYISRESYNDDELIKEIESLRESYKESDLNDFLDKLETSGVKSKMDEDMYEQLIIDIKADAERQNSKYNSKENLKNLDSQVNRNIRKSSQESLSSISKTKSSAVKKFERLKERILEMINIKRNNKDIRVYDKQNVKEYQGSKQQMNLSSTQTVTDTTDNKEQLREFKKSSTDSPLVDSKEINFKNDDRKGFKISEIFKKGSPKALRRKFSKENTPQDSLTDNENTNMQEEITVTENPEDGKTTSEDKKSISSPETKKEVRFYLKAGENLSANEAAVKTCEPSNVTQVVHKTSLEIEERKTESKDNLEIKNIIPVPVRKINKKIEVISVEKDENILPVLPERIRPPRRKKKKKLIPTTVENISLDSFEIVSQKSSDDSSAASPKHSIVFEADKNIYDLPDFSTQEQDSTNVCKLFNKKEDIILNNSQTSENFKEISKHPLDKAANEINSLQKDTDEKSRYETNEKAVVTMTDRTISPSEYSDNSFSSHSKKNELKNKQEVSVTIENQDITSNISSDKPEHVKTPNQDESFSCKDDSNVKRDSTPTFPEDNVMPSLYDNVNPYFEIMSKLDEEPDDVLESESKEYNDGKISICKNDAKAKNLALNSETEEPNFKEKHEIGLNTQKGTEFNEADKRKKIESQSSSSASNYLKDFSNNYGNNVNKSESFSRQVAPLSLETENKPYCIEDLNAFTDEIMKIANDMENEISLNKNTDKNSDNFYTGAGTNDITNKNTFIMSSQTKDVLSKIRRKDKTAYPSGNEYEETDFDTESEMDDVSVSSMKQTHKNPFLVSSSSSYFRDDRSFDDAKRTSHAQNSLEPKRPPAVPPRHFQQKMPLSVVKELKSVLSDPAEESRLKKPTLLPRWDSILATNNGRCNKFVSDVSKTSEVSTSLHLTSGLSQSSVGAADPQLQQSFSSTIPSSCNNNNSNNNNNLTPSNLITASVIKYTKPNSNEKTGRPKSYSGSDNLTPIPEKFHTKKFDQFQDDCIKFKPSFAREILGYSKYKKPTICKVRANVYPFFHPVPKIPKGKPPVHRPSNKRATNYQSASEGGYMSDPGAPLFNQSKENFPNDFGYSTDSEALVLSKNNFERDTNINVKEINWFNNINNNNLSHKMAHFNEPTPPRPPLPLEIKKLLKSSVEPLVNNNIDNYKNAHYDCDNIFKNKLSSNIGFKEVVKENKTFTNNAKNPVNVCTNASNISMCTQLKESSVDSSLKSISLSVSSLNEEHLKENRSQFVTNSGSVPEYKQTYSFHRERPLTWCAPSEYEVHCSQSHSGNASNVFTSVICDRSDELFDLNYKDKNPESRPLSQLSHSSSNRLQAQGLGEWLFLARLDHTNQLLSQLNFAMQLQPDRSPCAVSDHNEEILYSERKSPPPPPPPPRPRTPIDERDPEQVHGERKYLSYFHGTPRAKHPLGEGPPKPPTYQQVEAQKRYANYFIGPPQPNPNNIPQSSLDLENDEDVLAAKERYKTYFSGPPRPKSYPEAEKFLDDEDNIKKAQERYEAYFRSSIPRSRSTVSSEKTPEPDEEQKAAEKRYLSYFKPGPPKPKTSVEKQNTPEPDEEQIQAEKRYAKYFEGIPKAKHSKDEEPKRPNITAEMVAAEERFLKYFQPIPHGAPRKIMKPPPPSEEEMKKIKLFTEFQNALESRECRKEMKVIRVSKPKKEREREKTPPTLRDIVVEEFLQRVQDRKKEKDLHFGDTDDEEEEDEITKPIPKTVSSEEPIIQGGGTVDRRISLDLQLFLKKEEEVWSPGGGPHEGRTSDGPSRIETSDLPSFKDVPPVWTPIRAGSVSPSLGRKEYKKLHFEGTTLPRKPSQENVSSVPRPEESFAWKDREAERLRSSGLSSSSITTTLPRVQSPTVTLLQKRRDDGEDNAEGQIPGQRPDYMDEAYYKPGDKLYTIKREYESEDEEVGSRKFAVLGPRKIEGVGPTTRDGVPVSLKSGVKSEHQGEWYRRMFDSLHKVRDEDYIVIKYKSPKARYGGYMSEPDGYDSDIGSSRYISLDRRNKKFDIDISDGHPKALGQLTYEDFIEWNTKRYVHQPGRIENYVPGFSSLSEKELRDNPEADVKLEFKTKDPVSGSSTHRIGSGRTQMSNALKDTGYESDSTLVFRKREDQRRKFLDPKNSSLAYREVQKGGEIPLTGLQKPAPPKPREPVIGTVSYSPFQRHYGDPSVSDSPYKYNSSEVNIHYRTPVRVEQKESLSEEELARRQEEHMKRVYEQERRKKYLAELEDIERRRHTDNFTPLQKSPIPLNRYDDDTFGGPIGAKTPEPKQVARALFNFAAQNKRELSFNKGDIVTIRRSIDRNWYEGELRGVVGIFPCNYVEVIPFDSLKTLGRKPSEGQARARFNFQAQTAMEMSLSKGEMVILTRRVDENWYEGRVGNRRGIFPVTYVDVLAEPGGDRPISPSRDPIPRPALPAAHLLYNGTSSAVSTPYSTMGRSGGQTDTKSFTQLTVNTQQDSVPYRALYNYKPQNEDELELIEGDIVLVMEKCDDGWFVGTSKRTGLFGTFPGNYVEKC